MHRLSWIAAVAAMLAVVPVRAARAGDAQPLGKPFQLALFDPVQIVPRDEGVSGVAINVIYGKNRFIRGFEIGLVNNVEEDVSGYQLGIVDFTGGNHVGLQATFGVAITTGRLEGLQTGFVTVAGSTSGFQLGLVNHTKRARGLQLGLVNHTETMNGIQIGVVNIIEQGGWLPVTIIVNGSFP
jgi:hypothetical protein